jgi:hypothetical protein
MKVEGLQDTTVTWIYDMLFSTLKFVSQVMSIYDSNTKAGAQKWLIMNAYSDGLERTIY